MIIKQMADFTSWLESRMRSRLDFTEFKIGFHWIQFLVQRCPFLSKRMICARYLRLHHWTVVLFLLDRKGESSCIRIYTTFQIERSILQKAIINVWEDEAHMPWRHEHRCAAPHKREVQWDGQDSHGCECWIRFTCFAEPRNCRLLQFWVNIQHTPRLINGWLDSFDINWA